MNLLQDQVALITGGARGIGRAIAKAFVEEGAHVAIFDRAFPDDFPEFVASLRKTGRTVMEIPADITNGAATEKACD